MLKVQPMNKLTSSLKIKNAVLAGALTLLLGNAHASLFDRGGGLLYDNVLNITWLADANYAKTSGYSADGLMNWVDANAWADGLSFGGYTDWRLPTVTPVNGTSFNYGGSSVDLGGWGYDGSSDRGFNITSPNSELSFMYYVNLGLKGYLSSTGDFQPDFGVFGDGTVGGQKDVGLVMNLQSSGYWFGTAFHATTSAWNFYTGTGSQSHDGVTVPAGAWAVRDGDVAAVLSPVPEPSTYAMLLAGLGFLGFMTWRSKRNVGA
jgi:hypothetical protein